MGFGRLIIAGVVTMVLTTAVSRAAGRKTLHNFTGGSDGELPIWYGNLVFDNKGNLYGTGGPLAFSWNKEHSDAARNSKDQLGAYSVEASVDRRRDWPLSTFIT